MATGDDSTKPGSTRTPPVRVVAASVALVVVAVVAFFLVFRFVDAERERDLVDWQVRMGIIADGRTAEIEKWLTAQFDHLGGMSQNASLQIYLMALGEPADKEEQKAEEAYLRNLLIVSAENFGFAAREGESEVRANVAKVGTSGIALADMKGRPVVAIRGMPPLTGRLAQFLRTAPRAERAMLDLYRGPTGTPTMAFAVPIFAVHGDRVASEQIGFVLGVKEIAGELYPLLKQIGNPSQTGSDESGQRLLQLTVDGDRSANEANRAGSRAETIQAAPPGLDHLRHRAQPEVVIGGQDQHFAVPFHPHARGLRTLQIVQLLVDPLPPKGIQLLAQPAVELLAHECNLTGA